MEALLCERQGHPASWLLQGMLQCAAPLGPLCCLFPLECYPSGHCPCRPSLPSSPCSEVTSQFPITTNLLLPSLAQVSLTAAHLCFLSSSPPPHPTPRLPSSFFLSFHSTCHFITNQTNESLILSAFDCSLSVSLHTQLINSTWTAVFACFVC